MRWVSIPYVPINVKYILLSVVLFIVAMLCTSMSYFESIALSGVVYSTGLLLDRMERVVTFLQVSVGVKDE